MLYTWEIKIPSLCAGVPRKAYLYLPQAYFDDPEARFPVMYMFDGQNIFLDEESAFGTSWRMYDYMNNSGTPLIIVAIGNSENRMAEYSPFSHENGDGKVYARGRTYMNWLTRSLKPMIDRRLRTLPDRSNTIIAGSSMGGLMSLYAALDYNAYFGRAACLSPSLWVQPYKALRMIRSADIDPDTCIYFDYGAEEIGNHKENPEVLFDASNALLRKGVNLTFRIIPGGDHSEASWARQVPVMLKCLGF